MLPLDGITVIEMGQFLAAPMAATRLADLGALVIKVERPGTGDLARQIYNNEQAVGDHSLLFHTINRNKRSVAIDLKSSEGQAALRRLMSRADVVISSFRPRALERLGLGAEQLREEFPSIVYGRVSGYGNVGPWSDRPGQDLLAQALSGLSWLNGDANDGPVPIGLSVADMYAGNHLVQGLLAALVRRSTTGAGALVEVSLLESILDFQFEVLTTYLNDGHQPPRRSTVNNANAYLAAPYGFYATADGYIAVSMGSISRLGELLDLPELVPMTNERDWFRDRDRIKGIIRDRLATATTDHWLAILEPAGWWVAPVLDWPQLLEHDGFAAIDMLQQVVPTSGDAITTTRCPIRIDGNVLKSPVSAPSVGQHTGELLGTAPINSYQAPNTISSQGERQ